MDKQTDGQRLIERMEGWIRSYMVFPENVSDAALVMALYALNTWVYQVWSSTPYLCFSAATKGAGKTLGLELVAWMSKNAEVVAGPTPASLYRLAETYGGWMSLYFDEAEILNQQSAGPMRDLLNPGYRKGATMPRTAKGGEGVIKFPVYWPKAFALIGDVYSTLRDRSIVITTTRATPSQLAQVKRYRRDDAQREALGIVRQIESYIATLSAETFPVTEATWMSGREEELWTPLVSLATVIGLDKATMDRFVRVSNDLTALKTLTARRYSGEAIAQAEEDAQNTTYGEKALKDLRRVLHENENAIFSALAVQRMRELIDGPWRTYKGDGLTENRLADLLSRFDCSPMTVQMGKGRKGRTTAKGYKRADIVKAGKV